MKSNPFTEVAHRLPPSPVDQGHGNGRHGRREDEDLPRAQPSGEARKLLEHVSPSTDWQNEATHWLHREKAADWSAVLRF